MKKIYFGSIDLEQEKNFRDFVEQVKKDEEIKIKALPELVEVVEMKYDRWGQTRTETGEKHIGYDYQYIIIEYKGNYYYIQNEEFGAGFTITGYTKVSPVLKHQATFPDHISGYSELVAHINSQPLYRRYIGGTHDQNIYLLELSEMKRKAGFREMDIINNLSDIYVTQHDEHAHVIRLVSKTGDWCEYETVRNAFTN